MPGKDKKTETGKEKTAKALKAARQRASDHPEDPAAYEQLAAATRAEPRFLSMGKVLFFMFII